MVKTEENFTSETIQYIIEIFISRVIESNIFLLPDLSPGKICDQYLKYSNLLKMGDGLQQKVLVPWRPVQ